MSHKKSNHKPASGSYPRCYEKHPGLKIGEYTVYGGSCSSPMVTNADVYVGLDHSMKESDKSFPWNDGESFLFPITDMQPPKDPEQFKKLIDWLAVQLIAQKLVHIGCIGGHGRTGTVLAALVSVMTGEKDAITYVRKNYCEKAVESASQVDFLNKHFGITKVAGHKEYVAPASSKDDWYRDRGYPEASNPMAYVNRKVDPWLSTPKAVLEVVPTKWALCVWGDALTFDKPSNVLQLA